MPRSIGAKNKPKTDKELIKLLKSRGYTIHKGHTPGNIVALDPPAMAEPAKFEIEQPAAKPAEEQPAVYVCGACEAKLTDKNKICPTCGAGLRWE